MFLPTNMFVESLDLSSHPILKAKEKTRNEYYIALSYLVTQSIKSIEFSDESLHGSDEQIISLKQTLQAVTIKKMVDARLAQYANILSISEKSTLTEVAALKTVSTCVSNPWRKKHRLWLMCDAALILLDASLINNAANLIKEHLSKKQSEDLDRLIALFYDENSDYKKYINAEPLILQCRRNISFMSLKERRYIVTANMSAGKSTLINAIIGKSITRTSQEVCTGNICYIYNKAFEDGKTHLIASDLTFNANHQDLNSYLWDGEIAIASCFDGDMNNKRRVCIIDTPGVNASLYRQHSEITHTALLTNDYEKIVYILSPTNLGTDAEIAHLKWIAANTNKEKIIFVLNKLDEYHSKVDSIESSIEELRSELKNIGFENPTICPISAYFAFLLKMKLSGQQLSEDEEDEYFTLARKFNRDAYDLSGYYDGIKCLPDDSEEAKLSKRSGLMGFENLLYGGTL